MSDWFEFVQAIYKCLRAYHFFVSLLCMISISSIATRGLLALHFAIAQTDAPVSHHNIYHKQALNPHSMQLYAHREFLSLFVSHFLYHID